jgi:hypothetical protein
VAVAILVVVWSAGLPATLHDGIREQIDRPSMLVTDWLNLRTHQQGANTSGIAA